MKSKIKIKKRLSRRLSRRGSAMPISSSILGKAGIKSGQKRSKLKNGQKPLPSRLDKEVGLNQKSKFMATKDILEKAKKELADLTGFKSPSAIGFKKEGNELIATIEVIEKESIPDGMDVLGTYEVRVDESGKIIGYERTDLRKRVDTTLNKEA